MIKAVFFDFFNTLGTIVPSLEEMHQQALNEFGLQIPLPVISLAHLEADRLWAAEQSAGPLDRRPAVERERVHISYSKSSCVTQVWTYPTSELWPSSSAICR